jgi:hypothetical protein
MDLGLYPTLGILALLIGLIAFSSWRGRRPSEPLKVRMINYHIVTLVCIVAVMVMLAHLITIIAGHPVTGRSLNP